MKNIVTFLLLLGSLLQLTAAQSVTLAWDPSPDPDVQGTIIYYGGASRSYTNSTRLGNVTRATIGGLQEGGTYYFAVTVTNSLGLESEYSNEVSTNITSTVLHAPMITPIAAQQTDEDTATVPILFEVWDIDSNVTNLIVTADSSNKDLVKVAKLNIGLSGDGPYRQLIITPELDMFGVSTITLTVSDGVNSVQTSFLLTVNPILEPPLQLVFRSSIQVSSSMDGPWTNLVTTILPVPLPTNLFYRTWGVNP